MRIKGRILKRMYCLKKVRATSYKGKSTVYLLYNERKLSYIDI